MKNKLLFLTLLFALSLTLVSCKNRNFDDSFQTQSGYYENMKKQMEGADDILLDQAINPLVLSGSIPGLHAQDDINTQKLYRNSIFYSINIA